MSEGGLISDGLSCFGWDDDQDGDYDDDDDDDVDATVWSKETVDYKFLLTDPKISKSVLTQWFSESLYREVWVFWCFKSVRCVEFCLLMYFQCRAFVAPYKAWALQNTLTYTHPNPINIHTLHPYVHTHLLKVSRGKSGQQQTPTDTNRHQTTPTDGPRHH